MSFYEDQARQQKQADLERERFSLDRRTRLLEVTILAATFLVTTIINGCNARLENEKFQQAMREWRYSTQAERKAHELKVIAQVADFVAEVRKVKNLQQSRVDLLVTARGLTSTVRSSFGPMDALSIGLERLCEALHQLSEHDVSKSCGTLEEEGTKRARQLWTTGDAS